MPVYCWWEYKLVENSMEFPQKSKIELPHDPAIPFLGIYPKKRKTLIQKDTCTLMFMATLFINNSQEMARLPGGPVVRNLPACLGNTGLILGPGRFHVLQGN